MDLRVGSNASLSQVSFPAATALTTGAWSRELSLPAGSYALNAYAYQPMGQLASQTSSSFTLAAQNFPVSETYDELGNVTTRTVTDGTTTCTQTLIWDALGRLMSVWQQEFTFLDLPFGPPLQLIESVFTWRATYDARNRRVQTQFDGGIPQAESFTETSWHDPLVEFLEVGLEVTRNKYIGGTTWVTTRERWWLR